MNPTFAELEAILQSSTPRNWLVTGAAGFIGSHLVETLLRNGQTVTGIDNLFNGRLSNLDEVRLKVGPKCWSNFRFFENDICDIDKLKNANKFPAPFDFILHQAARGSVPRSIAEPLAANEANVTGTLHMLNFARNAGVKRFVFASSSSVYGDSAKFPQTEDALGTPQSPYAVSKRAAELYAMNFGLTYGLQVIGLRYFNVFGPRQRPDGPYAAVIPRWIQLFLKKTAPVIFGDGTTSRDFCFVQNVVKANILAALADHPQATSRIYNITMSGATSLNELCTHLRALIEHKVGERLPEVRYEAFRKGDIMRSQADIRLAAEFLRYEPDVSVLEGLRQTVDWHLGQSDQEPSRHFVSGATL